ncbi:hypothetical protein U1Q18_039409 [Sarracenia purpurea var. burkii]
MVEAFKHAYAVRMNLGDPDFVNVKRVLSDMLSPKFAAELRRTISPHKTFGPKYYGGNARNAVSMITSLNDYFGSRFLSSSTGIALNNEMGDFSTPKSQSPPPAPTNHIKPFKRALSSMIPTIVLKGEKLKAVLGGAGGVNNPAATTHVFLNHFVKGKDPFSSIFAPRYYHTQIPNVLYYDRWTSTFGDRFEVPRKTVSLLKKKGHVLRSVGGRAICQFIVQQLEGPTSGMLVAASDPREGGFPASY